MGGWKWGLPTGNLLIGREMDQQALIAMFDECLLTEDELSTDEKKWNKYFTDPFPEWSVVNI